MPHNRAPKEGADFYLPKYEYRTAVAFCFQYPELQRKLRNIDGFHNIVNDGMPHGTGTSDPTAYDAIKRAEIKAKIDIIEETVMETVGVVLYKWMILAVTDETMTYNRLRMAGIPLSKNLFSRMRRNIYYNVSKRI